MERAGWAVRQDVENGEDQDIGDMRRNREASARRQPARDWRKRQRVHDVKGVEPVGESREMCRLGRIEPEGDKRRHREDDPGRDDRPFRAPDRGGDLCHVD
jgi:hypothetical protein